MLQAYYQGLHRTMQTFLAGIICTTHINNLLCHLLGCYIRGVFRSKSLTSSMVAIPSRTTPAAMVRTIYAVMPSCCSSRAKIFSLTEVCSSEARISAEIAGVSNRVMLSCHVGSLGMASLAQRLLIPRLSLRVNYSFLSRTW